MSILKTVISENTVNEFSGSVHIKKGELANHGMLGTVKVLYISGDVAEVSDRHGKHFKVQLISLRPGAATDESVNENYDKHSAAANNYDHEIENGANDRATYKDAAKHHERAAKTAPSDALKKVHEKKVADYLEKARTTNEARSLQTNSTPYQELLDDMGWFFSMNMMKIADLAVDGNARQELTNMQKQFRAPIINGKNFSEVTSDPAMVKHPKVAPALLKFAHDIIKYVEPRLKKYVKPDAVSTSLSRLDSLKDKYRAAVQYVSGQQSTTEATQDERKETRTRALIADYEKRANATKNDTKKQHYMQMAKKLREELPVSESIEELAMPYTEVSSLSLWNSLAKKAKFEIETAQAGRKLRAYNKHGDFVGEFDTDKNKGFMAGSSVNELHKVSESIDQKSVLGEALEQINEWGIGADRHAEDEWHPAAARSMASNRSGKYCLTRDNPPVRGRGFLCFGSEKDAIFAWKKLSNNTGVKIVRESAFHDDGTPLKEGEVLLVDTSSIVLDEAVEDSFAYCQQLVGKLDAYLNTERQVLRAGLKIATEELGPQEARRLFKQDPDFAQDLLGLYSQEYGMLDEAVGEKKSAPAPRNFVAKNAKMGGAGAHKDQKRAAKQGDVKHKGKLEESEDGYAKVEKAIAQHKRTLKNKLATPANVAYAQKMIARGNAALKKSTGEEAYKHFQGSVKESVIDDLLALSEKL